MCAFVDLSLRLRLEQRGEGGPKRGGEKKGGLIKERRGEEES